MKNDNEEKIRSHKDLEVWKKSRELVKLIYKMTQNFPKQELYGLVSQIRRASVSVPTNIAEGFGRRHSRELIHFLYYSQGSLSEIETLVTLSYDLDYIDITTDEDFQGKIRTIRVMLSRLIQSIEKKDNNQ
ncbi:MAG: four helix bundle protein [Bacteroidetes bacterium]|nr:four helix bundle protein [Bacteroidota bacterium]